MDGVVSEVEVPGRHVSGALAYQVHFVGPGEEVFDILRRESEKTQAESGVAPVAVEAYFTKMDQNGVTGLGPFDVERAGERVAGLAAVDALLILAARVQRFCDHHIAGM